MKGAPSVYATKQDYYNAAEGYPAEAAAALKTLMDGRYIWREEQELASRDEGIEDALHHIQETEREEQPGGERKTVLLQMARVEDQNSAFFRMGWTVAEAMNFIATFGA